MKRLLAFCLLPTAFRILVLALLVGVLPSGATADRYQKGGQDTDAVRLVIGTDWRGTIRGGAYVTRCDGTSGMGGDQVGLQAAIDAAEADGPATGGGIVEIRGTLYVSPRVGEIAWAGTGKIDPTNTVTAQAWATGTINDLVVGQLVRIYDNAPGTDPSASLHYDDLVTTVATVNTGGGTFTFSPTTDLTYAVDNDISFRRIVPCVVLPPGVSLRGALPEVSRIKMQNDPPAGEYAIIATEDTGSGAGGHGYLVQALDIHGTSTANGNSAVTHGIVFNGHALETAVRDVAIWWLSGSGLVHNYCHGFRFTGTSWVEGCEEHGVIMSAGHAMILGPKSSGNARTNFLFKGAWQATLTGRSGVNADDSEGIVIIRSSGINVVGSSLTCIGDNAKAVRIGYQACENTITGNAFMFQTGTGMTCFDVKAHDNVLSNNAINISGVTITKLIGSVGLLQANNIVDNANFEDVDTIRYTTLTNNTGGQIDKWRLVIRPAVAGDQLEMATTTVVGDKHAVGLTQVLDRADGTVGWVQKCGWTTTFPGRDDHTFAVGELVGTSGQAGLGTVIGTAGNGQGAGYAIGVCFEANAAAGVPGDVGYLDVLLFDRPIYVP